MSHAIAVHHGSFGRAALYELDRPIITHAHREGHLLFYVSGARTQMLVDGTPVPLDAARAVAVSPWEPHSFELPDDTEACFCLVLYIKPMWFLETCQSAKYVFRFGATSIPVTAEIARWVGRLTSTLLDEEGSDLLDGYLYEATRQCYDESWKGADARAPLKRVRARFTDFRVRRSLLLMQENSSEEVCIDSLAREVGLSRPHFFKLFKKQMGITPNLYLNTLRAEQAIENLMTTDKSITDIGYDLGFSSQASFTRFFASNVGIPPSEYRRVAHLA
jgi:AraC-like DNA-binding protein